MPQDKQLRSIRLKDVLAKRRLDQALNAKEFAVAAGISYSTAREWFRLPGFPIFRGVLFWKDFEFWRSAQTHCLPLSNKMPKTFSMMPSMILPSVRPCYRYAPSKFFVKLVKPIHIIPHAILSMY